MGAAILLSVHPGRRHGRGNLANEERAGAGSLNHRSGSGSCCDSENRYYFPPSCATNAGIDALLRGKATSLVLRCFCLRFAQTIRPSCKRASCRTVTHYAGSFFFSPSLHFYFITFSFLALSLQFVALSFRRRGQNLTCLHEPKQTLHPSMFRELAGFSVQGVFSSK